MGISGYATPPEEAEHLTSYIGQRLTARFFGDGDLEDRLKLLWKSEMLLIASAEEACGKGRTDSCGLGILGYFERRAVGFFRHMMSFVLRSIRLQVPFASWLLMQNFYVYIRFVGLANYNTRFNIKTHHSVEVEEYPMPTNIQPLQAPHWVQLPYS